MTDQPFQRFVLDVQAARVLAINNRATWGSTDGRARLDHPGTDIPSLFM